MTLTDLIDLGFQCFSFLNTYDVGIWRSWKRIETVYLRIICQNMHRWTRLLHQSIADLYHHTKLSNDERGANVFFSINLVTNSTIVLSNSLFMDYAVQFTVMISRSSVNIYYYTPYDVETWTSLRVKFEKVTYTYGKTLRFMPCHNVPFMSKPKCKLRVATLMDTFK